MNTFYAFTIYPLELAYKHLYIIFSSYVGSYGAGLLCLSLLSSIIFFPLKKLVAGIQDMERKTQAAMAPQMAKIKKESSGAEAQARIRALYKRYSYHPLKALRSSVGLFLQLPFLCAAYYMLSSFEPVRGVSFGLVSDLGLQDGILWGVNGLPILMTIFNLCALYSTRGFSKRDQKQGVLVALLFLVLLYKAPSALLIYWTTNNLFSLLETLAKNLYSDYFESFKSSFVKARPALPASTLRAMQYSPDFKSFLSFFAKASLIFLVIPLNHLVHAYAAYWHNETPMANMGFYTPLFFAILLLSGLAIFIFCYAQKNQYSQKRKLFISLVIMVVLFSLGWKAFAYMVNAEKDYLLYQRDFLFSLDFALVALGLVSADYEKLNSEILAFLKVPEDTKIFFFSAFTLVLTVLFLTPFLMYKAEPLIFGASYKVMSEKLIPYALMTLLLLFVARLLLPEIIRPLSSFIMLTLFLIIFLNSTLFTGDFGVIDSLSLSQPEKLYAIDLYLKDFLILFLCLFICLAIYYFKKTKTVGLILQSSALVLTVGLASLAFIFFPSKVSYGEENTELLDEAFSFSKDKDNVMIFVLDMFTGGHVENIFENKPDLKEKFAGFTWYPDTLAHSHMTSASMPGLLGGPEYTYRKMNERPDLTLMEKFVEALAVMPRNFSQAEYKVHLVEAMYNIDEDLLHEKVGNRDTVLIPSLPESRIIKSWADKIGLSENDLALGDNPEESAMYIATLSLFRAAPHHYKKDIYNDKQWLDFTPESSPRWFNDALYQTGSLGLLPEFSSTDSDKATFKLIYSLLPHYPWHLPQDGFSPVKDPYEDTEGLLVKVDGYMPEHLYTEIKTFEMLASYFDWMRAEGIYDNTKIILVSDHCEADSSMLNKALGVDEEGVIAPWEENKAYPGRPHALLMVKELGQNKGFKVSRELMATEDVPALACQSIGGCPEAPYPDTGPDRTRSHYYSFEWRQIEVPGRKVYDKAERSLVHGTMFNIDNWENYLEP